MRAGRRSLLRRRTETVACRPLTHTACASRGAGEFFQSTQDVNELGRQTTHSAAEQAMVGGALLAMEGS